MNKSNEKILIKVIESSYQGEDASGEMVFGISVIYENKEKIIQDLSSNKSAVSDFALRLSRNSFGLENLFEIVEDFIEELLWN